MTAPGLPEGLELDVRQDALTANPQKTYRTGDTLPTGITVEGTRERPEVRVDTDKIHIHIARLSGPGTGSIHLAGDGAGTAIRDGIGHGDAIRSGKGDGDAIRCGREEHGDAVRMGAGLGNALREGAGPGDALCRGMGGDAVRNGPGPGTATREERGRATLRHRVMMSIGKTGIAATIMMSAYAHTHAQPIIGASDLERVERPVAEFRLDGPPGPATAADGHRRIDSKADAHRHDRSDPGRSIAPAATALEAEQTNRVADGNEIPRSRARAKHDGRSASDARGDTEPGGSGAKDTEHGHGERATPERHGQKHKTVHVDHGGHDHGGHKAGHGTAHKAHHEHLPEDEKERRKAKFRKAKTPLQEALERHRRQPQMERTSGGNPGTRETPTRTAGANGPEGPKSMPPIRSGGGAETPVGPTPPKPASGYAAAHDHGRAADSHTR